MKANALDERHQKYIIHIYVYLCLLDVLIRILSSITVYKNKNK